jgi:hypothetical protein
MMQAVALTLLVLTVLGSLVAFSVVLSVEIMTGAPTVREMHRRVWYARARQLGLYEEDVMGDEGRNLGDGPKSEPSKEPPADPTAEEARDADLALVAEHNAAWMADAMEVIEALPADFRGIGEDISILVREKAGEPKSPNAFGALIANAKKRQLIRWTGEMAPMRGLKSNARMSFVYVKGEGLVEAAE